MPFMATRKLRNLAAALTLVSGVSHVAQLWFVALDGPALFAALVGILYLLLGLGLAGRSRFSLFLGVALPAVGCAAAWQRLLLELGGSFPPAHIAVDIAVIALCLYVLVKTWHVEMD